MGLTCQQLLENISAPNEWSNDLELRMLFYLSGIDVVSINFMDGNCAWWRLDPIYNHAQLTPPVQCKQLYQGQKLGILYHRLFHH